MEHTVDIKLVKVEEKGTHLLVDAFVNGRQASFIIDTGASQTVMDKTRAKHFLDGAGVEESETLSKGLGTDSMQSFTTMVNSLSMGSFKVQAQEIVLLDLSHVVNSYIEMGHPAIDGVIGGDILSDHEAVIDYGKQKLILST